MPALKPNANRYTRSLEQAPELIATLNDESTRDLGLRDEVGLARMLLDQILQQLGELHGKSGHLNPLLVQSVSSMLAQVQGIVRDAAAIEAKRNDQKISATHMLTLLVSLRDNLKRRLIMSFGEAASQIVEDVFANARWTGGLRDEDVHDAMLEPAAFDLRLHIVDREGDALREAAKAHSLTSPELLALGGSESEVERVDPLALPLDASNSVVGEGGS